MGYKATERRLFCTGAEENEKRTSLTAAGRNTELMKALCDESPFISEQLRFSGLSHRPSGFTLTRLELLLKKQLDGPSLL